MKRCKRMLALLLAVILGLSLCGCQRLDEMRANHGVWQEDGSILWNNAVYKRLPRVMGTEYNIDYDGHVYVTEPDVPVLLSEDYYSEFFQRDKKGVLLYGRERGSSMERGYALYCRSDLYEDYAQLLANGFEPKGLCYDYFDNNSGESKTYYLTVEQEYEINYIIDAELPYSYGSDFWDGYYELRLYEYDEKDLCRREYCTLYYDGVSYWLYSDMYELLYWVPEDRYQTFYDIVKAGYENEYWMYEKGGYEFPESTYTTYTTYSY